MDLLCDLGQVTLLRCASVSPPTFSLLCLFSKFLEAETAHNYVFMPLLEKCSPGIGYHHTSTNKNSNNIAHFILKDPKVLYRCLPEMQPALGWDVVAV